MVTRYAAISRMCSSHFWVKMHVFSTSLTKKVKLVVKMKQSVLSFYANVSSFSLAESPPRDVQLFLATNTILLVRKWNHACSSFVYVISVITSGRQRVPTAFRRYYLLKNKLSDRMIKQLLNSVIAKYCDLSAQINYLPKPKAEANSWSARYWQITIFCLTSSNNC